MRTRTYGKTGKEISVIGFGAMQFPHPEKIDEMAELVIYAHQQGINYFDTAPGYCQDKSEIILGAAFKHMNPGSYYLSTKSMKPDGDELRKDLEQSLQRMGLEKIHFFHIWNIVSLEVWRERLDGGAVAAAIKAKEEGLIEHLAVSSHLPGDQLAELLKEGLFEGVTLGYCAINFPYRQKAVDLAGQRNLGVATMNPLGGGLIPQNAERFDFIREPGDCSVVSAALRFNLSHPAVTCALVGFSEKDHIDQAVAAVGDFTPYSKARIQKIREKILDSFNDLCTGCQYCLPCPAGLEIPRLMEAYNWRILWNDSKKITDRLKWHWRIKAETAQACTLCGECEERCTQHIPIRDRMKFIASLEEAEE